MHNRACVAAVLLSCFGLLCFAEQKKEKTTFTVKALGYRAIPHERTTHYQTQGYSNTTCYGSGTNWGYSTSINVNCSTVTTPPQDVPITVRSVEVYNQVEARGMVYTIRCTANWVGSGFTWLVPGDRFPAEVEGTTMWITAHKGGNLGKRIRPKFRILDARPMPTSTN